MKSSSATASSTSAVTDTDPPEAAAFASAIATHRGDGLCGPARTNRIPNWVG